MISRKLEEIFCNLKYCEEIASHNYEIASLKYKEDKYLNSLEKILIN